MREVVFEKTFLVGRNAMRVSMVTFNANERIDMRMMFYDPAIDKLVPTRKGVNFTPALLPGIIEMLRQLHMLSGNRDED